MLRFNKHLQIVDGRYSDILKPLTIVRVEGLSLLTEHTHDPVNRYHVFQTTETGEQGAQFVFPIVLF